MDKFDLAKKVMEILKDFNDYEVRDISYDFDDKFDDVFSVTKIDDAIHPGVTDEILIAMFIQEIYKYLYAKAKWEELKEDNTPHHFRQLKAKDTTIKEPTKRDIRLYLSILHNGTIPRNVEQLINSI